MIRNFLKEGFIGLIVVIILTVSFGNKVYSAEVTNKFENENKKIILIDPGHGGIDGGAEAKDGTMEKDINLKISTKIKNNLEKKGYKIFMTRNDDKGLYSDSGRIRKKKIEDLSNRCKMKKDTNCDMFVSIHLNKFPDSKYYGAQVWYSKNDESKKLANILQNNLIKDIDHSNKRKEKSALDKYKVLRENDNMPSVIVECGFLSNSIEKDKLKDDAYQTKIAESIAKSIDQYYK